MRTLVAWRAALALFTFGWLALAQSPPSDPAASAALVKAAAKARAGAQTSRDTASKAQTELAALVAERKKLSTALQAERQEQRKRLAAARSALQRYEQKVALGPGGDAERTLLETALREYAAAETQADVAQRTSQAQRKVEESLATKLQEGATAAVAAQQRSQTAQQQVTQLKALAKSAVDDVQRVSNDLSSLATSAQSGAQLNPGNYAARRTKVAADDAKLAQKLQVAQAQLDEAERQLALLAAADRQAKQAATPGACEVKKVDWANRMYMGPFNGAFTLAKGGAHNTATGELYQLGPVSYGDLNGNGSTEAYVPIQGPGGPRGGYHLTVYVYEVDKSCVAKLLANLDGGPYAETGALKGKAYVIQRNQLGELGMPGDEETIKFVFKGGKYVEEG
jgi:hypothetical protein